MPTIPRLERQGPSSVRSVRADVGQAVTGLGKTVSAIDDRMQQARRAREVNEAVTEATRRISEHEGTLQADRANHPNWQEENKAFLEETRNDLGSELGDVAVRDIFNQRFNTMGVHSETRVRQGARRAEVGESRSAIVAAEDVLGDNYASLKSPVDRAATLDGVDDMYDAAVDTGVMTAEEAEQRGQAFVNRAENLRVLSDIDADPTAALAGIESGLYGLEEKDRQVAKARAERDIVREQKAREAAVAKQQQETWTAIFDGIDQDKMGREDIEKAYDTLDPETGMRGLSDPGKRALLGRLKAHDKAKAKLGSALKVYQTSIQDGTALDYKLKEHREAAEAGFLQLAPELPDLDPRAANTKIINQILRPTKIWPTSLQSQMRIATKHGSMDTIESFSNLYDRVSNDATVSAVNKSMVSEDQAFWKVVGKLRQSGMFAKEAVELAKHNAFEMTDDERGALKSRYKDRKHTKGNKNSFGGFMSSFDPTMGELAKLPDIGAINWSNIIAGAPDAPPGMAADYENLTRMFFDYTGGDIELSRELASENLKRAWIIEEDDE